MTVSKTNLKGKGRIDIPHQMKGTNLIKKESKF